MIKLITRIFQTACAIFAIAMMFAVTASAQSTSGTVTMNATVSKFVEINSGGAVTLGGNTGGGVTTDGTANSPLAAVVNLGELGLSAVFALVATNCRTALQKQFEWEATLLSRSFFLSEFFRKFPRRARPRENCLKTR